MSDVFLCVVRSVINVNKFEVRLLPSSHLKSKFMELPTSLIFTDLSDCHMVQDCRCPCHMVQDCRCPSNRKGLLIALNLNRWDGDNRLVVRAIWDVSLLRKVQYPHIIMYK